MIKLTDILKETQSKFRIDKSSIHGEGLFTNVDIPSNTKVLAIGDVTRDPKHILTSYGKKINHSSNPNIEIKIIGDIAYIYSIKPIKANEELVADYTKLPEPFDRSTKFLNELEIKKPEFSDNERLIIFLNKNKQELIDKLISKLIIRKPENNKLEYPISTGQFKELLNKYAQFDIDGSGDVNIDRHDIPLPIYDGVSFSFTNKTSLQHGEVWKPLQIANKTIYYITY